MIALHASRCAAQISGCHGGALVQTRHEGLGVVLEMKLTALPEPRREDGRVRRAKTGDVVNSYPPSASASESAAYDLKAVNPNRVREKGTRAPIQLRALIGEK